MPPTTTRPKKSVLHRVVNRVRSVPLGQISLSMLKQAKTLSTKLPKRIPAGILEKARALAGKSAPSAVFALTVALLLIVWKARAARKKKQARLQYIMDEKQTMAPTHNHHRHLTPNQRNRLRKLYLEGLDLTLDLTRPTLLNKISHPVDTWKTRKLRRN